MAIVGNGNGHPGQRVSNRSRRSARGPGASEPPYGNAVVRVSTPARRMQHRAFKPASGPRPHQFVRSVRPYPVLEPPAVHALAVHVHPAGAVPTTTAKACVALHAALHGTPGAPHSPIPLACVSTGRANKNTYQRHLVTLNPLAFFTSAPLAAANLGLLLRHPPAQPRVQAQLRGPRRPPPRARHRHHHVPRAGRRHAVAGAELRERQRQRRRQLIRCKARGGKGTALDRLRQVSTYEAHGHAGGNGRLSCAMQKPPVIVLKDFKACPPFPHTRRLRSLPHLPAPPCTLGTSPPHPVPPCAAPPQP